ncbi:MAG: UvrB/UvrC motif-containing protein, partial [Planctomycetota bacterium]
GIIPQTINKAIRRGIESELKSRRTARDAADSNEPAIEASELASVLEGEMLEAAENLNFEKAAGLRDQLNRVRELILQGSIDEEGTGRVMIRRSEIEGVLKGNKKKGGKKRRKSTGRPKSAKR